MIGVPAVTIALPDPGQPNRDFGRPADRAHLERTAAALASRGFDVQIADSAKEARQLVLEKIPEGAQVHTALSETMRELGIAAELDDSGRYESIRSQLNALDRETQGREMRKLAAAPDYVIGSAHAVTDAGEIIVGSGSGSQLGAYAYAAGHVILAIGHQKLVPDLGEGLRRVREYSLPREHARMQSAGRAGSMLTKTLIIHSDPTSRITIILVPETLGF
jgi:LUD domain